MTTTQSRPRRAPSTTPLLLRGLRAAMVILALLTGAAAALVTVQEHAVVASAGGHTAAAVMQASAAHQELADANHQAVLTIRLGAGPAGQFQDDIAAAEQNLEHVAENNTAGAVGTDALQFIEGLLPTYLGLIEQADAHFRMQAGEDSVGVEDLWEATDLMLGQILTDDQSTAKDSVTDLQAAEQAALTRQQSSPWASPWLSAVWLVPAVALLLTLVATQRLLYRRLRRVLSKYLTMATAAVFALGIVASHVIVSEHSFRAASRPLSTVITRQTIEAVPADMQVDMEFTESPGGLIASCTQCTATQLAVDHLVLDEIETLPVPAAATRAPCPAASATGCITAMQDAYNRDVVAAQADYGASLVLIAVLTVVLLLLMPLALWRYLDEYRYRES